MLRILSDLCPSSRGFRRQWLTFFLVPALTAACGLGCESQAPHLVAKGLARQDRDNELTTEQLLPSQFADDGAQPKTENDPKKTVSGLSTTDRPLVSRLQKPDSEPPKQVKRGSLLDLVSYETAVPGNTEVAARIRATVNGVVILDQEVREAVYPYLLPLSRLPPAEREVKQKEVFQAQLQHLIEREIILQDAFSRLKERPQMMEKFKEMANKEVDKQIKELRGRANVKSDEDFKAMLKQQGMSMSGLRRFLERQYMSQEYMRNRVADALDRISHEQIEDYYRLHPEEFQVQDNVTWNDLFIDAGKFPSREASRQFAEKIMAKAKAGEDFLKLVKEYDNGDSSYRHGEGYGHRKGEIKPTEAEPILFKMQQSGEIGPLIELAYGFHVIQLVKREYAGLKPFDEKTQTAVRNKLKMEAFEREYLKILADLKRKASIEISASTY